MCGLLEMKLPKRLAPILFGLIMSGVVALIVSGAITLLRIGMIPGWAHAWLSSYILAWAVAFPSVVTVAPVAHRLVAALTRE